MTRNLRFGSAMALAAVVLALLGAPRTAGAVSGIPQPPNPVLSGYYTWPDVPYAGQATNITLHGSMPYGCGEIVSSQVVDAGHVAITFRQAQPCPDTTGAASWALALWLGSLDAGSHPVTVTLTVENDPAHSGATTLYSESLAFDVLAAPPAPQPHDMGSWLVRCLGGYVTQPSPPEVGGATTLTLWGWYPYFCGQVVGARVSPADSGSVRLALTLEPGPACSDTAQTWSQPFDLGELSLGYHTMIVDLTVIGDPATPGTDLREGRFALEVVDSVPPPPPPPAPPVDSIPKVSVSRPNPFQTVTHFSVTLQVATNGDLGVYDISGRRVTTLHRGELAAGTHEFQWDGKVSNGASATAGIYFYRLAVPGRVVTRRVVLLSRK